MQSSESLQARVHRSLLGDVEEPAPIAASFEAPQKTIFTRFTPPLRPEDMPGRWEAYYTKWREVTREKLDPALIKLMPSLKRFVPPAAVIEKAVYSAFAAPGLAAAGGRKAPLREAVTRPTATTPSTH